MRALNEGIDAVAGAVDFVRSLPPDLPKSGRLVKLDPVDSRPSRPPRPCAKHSASMSTAAASMWIAASRRPTSIFMPPSGSASIFAAPSSSRIRAVGANGALASGATVIGLAVGRALPRAVMREHASGLGVEHVARSFEEVRVMLGANQTSR